MNRIILTLVVSMFTGCAFAQHTFKAADERVRIMGRHLVAENGTIDFGASGVTFYFRFEGARFEVELEDEFRDGNHNWFTVVVDGGEPVRFRTEPGQRRYTLAEGLSAGPHELVLSKATEGQNGHNRLVAVHTGNLLEARPLPSRKIEFIGDSITSGYGLDSRPVGCDDGTWYDQTHAWLAFGPRIARSLETQWMLSSVSGIGMFRNWNSPGPVMPDVYEDVYMEYTEKVVPWDFSRYTPDLVVITLGTNDFSAGDGTQPRPELDGEAFVRNYTRFVQTVHGKYPNARFLLVNSPTFDPAGRAVLDGYLQQVAENSKTAGIKAMDTFAFETVYATGCDGHPDLQEHIHMAEALGAKVEAVMGW